MAMTIYVSSLDLEERPFVAIPVFPVRAFRHSAIYVNVEAGIRDPKDLIGKRMGEFVFYGHDAGLWPKRILSSEYGVPHDSYTYFFGGVGHPAAPQTWVPSRPPASVRGEHIGTERTLDAMLEAGEIDALMSAVTPPALLNGSKKVRRLFEDFETVERDYCRKTGIFPIMHTLVIRSGSAPCRSSWTGKALGVPPPSAIRTDGEAGVAVRDKPMPLSMEAFGKSKTI